MRPKIYLLETIDLRQFRISDSFFPKIQLHKISSDNIVVVYDIRSIQAHLLQLDILVEISGGSRLRDSLDF